MTRLNLPVPLLRAAMVLTLSLSCAGCVTTSSRTESDGPKAATKAPQACASQSECIGRDVCFDGWCRH